MLIDSHGVPITGVFQRADMIADHVQLAYKTGMAHDDSSSERFVQDAMDEIGGNLWPFFLQVLGHIWKIWEKFR